MIEFDDSEDIQFEFDEEDLCFSDFTDESLRSIQALNGPECKEKLLIVRSDDG